MEQLNDFLSVSDNQTINYNKDIMITDLEGNSQIVVKCYCTIVANKSISYYMDVLNIKIFESQKTIIQEQIDIFKQEAEQLAKNNNVPLI